MDHYTIRMPAVRGTSKLRITPDEWDAHWKARHQWEASSCPPAITPQSPIAYRRAVYRCAQYFRREFHYDFVQYGYEGREDDPNSRAFLWFERSDNYHSTVIGACSFRWREYSNAPACWALQWIWLHPYERRKGHLTEYWPYFRARFGEFDVEPPRSPAMREFLRKNAPWREW